MITISNQQLRATISLRGAEMLSLQDCNTQQEYFWTGDPAFWKGHAPLLFPIVGSLWNGEFRLDGQAYRVPKHGFVRHRDWQVVQQQAGEVILAIERSPEEQENFPWPYRLEVCYKLEGRKLQVDLRVYNLSQGSTMWFQIGGHPSTLLPDWKAGGQGVLGYLRFEGEPLSMLRAGEQGCLEAQRVPVPWSSDVYTAQALARHQLANALVPICVETFAHEALIFDHYQVCSIEVLDAKQRRLMRVASSAPAWLVWAPQGVHAPFVCCEPWYGLPDVQGFHGSVQERPHIQHLAPGHSWTGWYSIEV